MRVCDLLSAMDEYIMTKTFGYIRIVSDKNIMYSCNSPKLVTYPLFMIMTIVNIKPTVMIMITNPVYS